MMARTRNLFGTMLLGGLFGCGGGGGGGGGDDSSSAATLSVAMTDAASDEISSFVVDVASIELTHANGAVVSLLSSPARVDLVSLSDLSQILNVMDVPSGRYQSATITLDFTNGSCFLVGESTAATIVDTTGAPVTGLLTMPMQFGKSGITISASRHQVLEFDFDLNQSVIVDSASNVVTMEPAFVMRLDRSDPKELIMTGTLVSVDEASETLVVELTTFSGQQIKEQTFVASDATVYQIDGVPSQGAAGLAALSAKPAGTWVQGYGAVDPQSASFHVLYLEAGAGTYNGGNDIIEGHIVARSGGAGADAVLTVLGYSNNASHTSFLFNTAFTINTTLADTEVVRRASSSSYDTDDLNVGQLVRVFGSLSGTTVNATSGVIREQPTRVLGYASGAPAGGTLTLDLNRVDLRVESAFNWSDGGTTPPDPDVFDVKVGSLGQGQQIDSGSAIEARGYFPAVDDDGDDFVATSLTNRDHAPSLMLIRDQKNGFLVATATSATDIAFTITGEPNPGEVAVIDKGFVGTTALPSVPTPTVIAKSGFQLYSICDHSNGSVAVYLDFADFTEALGLSLESGRKLVLFAGVGKYDDAANVLTAPLAKVVVR